MYAWFTLVCAVQVVLDLGNFIVNIARIVPNGLLVFFPSYTVMTVCESGR